MPTHLWGPLPQHRQPRGIKKAAGQLPAAEKCSPLFTSRAAPEGRESTLKVAGGSRHVVLALPRAQAPTPQHGPGRSDRVTPVVAGYPLEETGYPPLAAEYPLDETQYPFSGRYPLDETGYPL
ncbi:Hypothetical predicted protein [Pelobates cultripes]|uniref:Uncharacterized protein n=1 Tax=Pelobates cultripes TaxID=61616 RepID=A0AAD1VPC7_PELCU|nr:Hypothetical predicted protein [Pelobates cultripes]